jgi:hypothetical protein
MKQLLYKQCHKAPRILPVETFCPIHGAHHWKLFDTSRSKLVLQKIHESNSFGVKLWIAMKISNDHDDANLGSSNFTTAFYQLAKNYCPLTVQLLGQNRHF